MESFISNENKGLLWGLLQENNVFQGIENTKFNQIKKIFEETILKKKDDFKGSLVDLNKETMTVLVKQINNFKEKGKISMIYKAEDFQNNRVDELNFKMKQQENDLNSILNPDIPKEISFSEADVDKPLGENLERAIAEMQASRERELEKLPIDKDAAEKWINNGNKQEKSKKNVTFSKDNNLIKENNNIENFDILSKLKRKTDIDNTLQNSEHENNISNEKIFQEILNIKKEILLLKKLISEKI